jgi:hypothetical protein
MNVLSTVILAFMKVYNLLSDTHRKRFSFFKSKQNMQTHIMYQDTYQTTLAISPPLRNLTRLTFQLIFI